MSETTIDASSILIHELLNEKIRECKENICNLEFGKLKSELDLLTRIGAVGGEIQFYKVLLMVHNKYARDTHR